MGDTLTWIVRYVHIFSAVMWIGAAMLFSMLIAPRVLRDGPPMLRRPFLEAVLGPLTRYFAIATVLTLVSGFILIGQIFGWSNYHEAFRIPRYGTAMGLGVIVAILTAIVGFEGVARSGKKLLTTMQSLPANAPPSPEKQAELAALGKRVGMLGMLTVLLGTIALGAMTFAVNVAR